MSVKEIRVRRVEGGFTMDLPGREGRRPLSQDPLSVIDYAHRLAERIIPAMPVRVDLDVALETLWIG